MIGVMGLGPRVGTSFVMGELEKRGFPVYYDKEIQINGSGYDGIEFPEKAAQSICKVWPWMDAPRMSLCIGLYRQSREAQVSSIEAQSKRELSVIGDISPLEVMDRCNSGLGRQLMNIDEIHFFATENLNREIETICQLVKKEVVKCQ